MFRHVTPPRRYQGGISALTLPYPVIIGIRGRPRRSSTCWRCADHTLPLIQRYQGVSALIHFTTLCFQVPGGDLGAHVATSYCNIGTRGISALTHLLPCDIRYQGEISALIHFGMATFFHDGDPGCTAGNWNGCDPNGRLKGLFL